MLETTAMRESSALLSDPPALRARAQADGYLFFKGLLARERVFDLRRRIVEILVRHGYVDAGPGPGRERVIHETVAAQPREQVIEQCMTVPLYADVQRLEAFHALPHDPALLGLYATLFGERPLPHPRDIVRIIMPGESFFPTPPHQDFHLVQGTTDTWTCWMPLGDTPLHMGPLTVMPGSHKHGPLETVLMPGAGATGVKIGHLPARWVSADFEAGDLVTFNSLTVHRALPQADRDVVRISMDARFQPGSQPIQAMSLRPSRWSQPPEGAAPSPNRVPGWEEIYAGWPDSPLKYYWRDFDLKLTDFRTDLVPFLRDMEPAQLAAVKARMDDRTGL